jgi:hypothetical protein
MTVRIEPSSISTRPNAADPTKAAPARAAAPGMDGPAAVSRRSLVSWLSRSRPQNLLALPFIYSMAVPLLLVDLWFSLYQWICFPLFGIARVERGTYFAMDRARLPYLNAIEKVHCAYCSYANGLLAFATEIAARTEQYWCPIQHRDPPPGVHSRHAGFLPFGDASDFESRAQALRARLRTIQPGTRAPDHDAQAKPPTPEVGKD